MSRRLRFIPALGAVLFAAAGLVACGGVPSGSVVQVNGNAITKSTFDHWMGVAAAATAASPGGKPVLPEPPDYSACIAHLQAVTPKPAKGQTPPTTAELKTECEQQFKSLQQEVLGFLISADWVIGEAESLGVKLSDKEVEKEFEKIKNQQFPKASEFERFLQNSGETVSDLLLRVKLNLLSSKIQQKIAKKKPNVTQADVEKYYNENKEKLGTPEKRTIAVILTKTEEQALKAKKEIESGKSFAEVAKASSIDPTSKNNGGVIVGVVKGEEEAALSSAVFAAKPNVLNGPVKTPFGYYIYEVKSISPGNQPTLAASQATIKQQLTAQDEQEGLSKFVKEFKKKWTEKTECLASYSVMDCKGYKAPKTGTTGAETP